mmetsp:Transcript_7407/g.10640  ORF Transcript_7407/g.10640 Transcript_7407/m.10640 type:complete len:227 (+) Transcript_7407:104-784(+)
MTANLYNLEHINSSKSRDGSWDVVGSDERHNGNHGKTSVVKLTVLLGLKSLVGDTAEVNWWENNSWEWTSLGVVNSLGLSGELGDEDGSDDLGLSSIRDSFPSIEWLHGRKRLEGDIRGKLSWEVESGSLDDVSSGGKHGNTGVLELSSTEPEKGLLGSNKSKTEWVELLDWHGDTRHVIKSHGHSSAGLGDRSWGESSGRAEKSEKSSDLHVDFTIRSIWTLRAE